MTEAEIRNVNYSAWDILKPPLGLKPKYIWKKDRFISICEAISRYYNAGKKIPVEWIEEYNELVEEVKQKEPLKF